MKDPTPSMSKLNWKVNGRLFGFGTSPDADWKIIFITTTMLSIFVIISSVILFVKVDTGGIFIVEKSTEQEAVVLDISLLKETVLYYQNKALEFERIKDSVVPIPDPSL